MCDLEPDNDPNPLPNSALLREIRCASENVEKRDWIETVSYREYLEIRDFLEFRRNSERLSESV